MLKPDWNNKQQKRNHLQQDTLPLEGGELATSTGWTLRY